MVHLVRRNCYPVSQLLRPLLFAADLHYSVKNVFLTFLEIFQQLREFLGVLVCEHAIVLCEVLMYCRDALLIELVEASNFFSLVLPVRSVAMQFRCLRCPNRPTFLQRRF